MREELCGVCRFYPSRKGADQSMPKRSVSREWTESDIEQLRAVAGIRSAAEIAVELDRTIGGIIQKAFDLKLSLRLRVPKPPPAESKPPQA
jgi:hypothetical protein